MSVLANHKGARDRRHEADTMYGRALTLVYAAIGVPSESKTDETLMCVLLLQLFEVCSSHKYFLYLQPVSINQGFSRYLIRVCKLAAFMLLH